ncbi:MAG: hypothetical protein PHE93_03155 [Clostridia bacterium]|nr:hypothetical protein [Clostridia bacterium]
MKKLISILSIIVIILGFCFIETEEPFYKKRQQCQIAQARNIRILHDDIIYASTSLETTQAKPNFVILSSQSQPVQAVQVQQPIQAVDLPVQAIDLPVQAQQPVQFELPIQTVQITHADQTELSILCFSANSKEIFDMINPQLINFYETYFAKEKIITNIKPLMLERMTQTYNASVNKMYALIVLQNIASKNGEKVTLSVLAEKSNVELINFGKVHFETYINNLPEEEKKLIGEKFDELKKGNYVPKL